MRFLKMLRHDIKQGIINQSARFLIIVIVVITAYSSWNIYLGYLREHDISLTNVNMTDCFMYIFSGMQVYRFDPKAFISPPLTWIVFNIMILYVTAYYPGRDMENYGKTIFMAGKTRTSWWLSKMLWCALAVVICYLLTFFLIWCIASSGGYKWNFDNGSEFLISQYGNSVRYLDKSDVYLLVFILPIVISIALCEFQMLIGFILTPVISFAAMSALFVFSIYNSYWWLLPNYTMWRRSVYYDVKGFSPLSGLILSGYLLMFVLVYGVMIIRRRDIM